MSKTSKSDSIERRIIGVTSSVHGMNHGLELTYAAVLSSIARHFDVDLLFLGIVANLAALGYGALALPSGVLADRWGSKRVIILSLLGGGILSLLVAVSPNVNFLAIALIVMGLAAGLYHPAGLALITRGVDKKSIGLGYHGLAGNLGVAFTPAIAGAIAGAFSWRLAFVVFGILSIFLAVIVHFMLVDEHGGNISSQNKKTNDFWRSLEGFKPMLKPFAAIFLINIFAGVIYRGAITFLPLHVENQVATKFLGIDPVTLAGSLTTIALLFGAVGQYVGGYLGESVQREKLVTILAILLLPSLLFLAAVNGMAIVIGAGLFALFYFMAQPAYNTLVADYTPQHLRGTSYGLCFFATFGLGSFGGSLSGYVANEFGTHWVFLMLSGFAFAVLALSVYLLIYSKGIQSSHRRENS